MRRFKIFLRSGVYYAQLFNPQTSTYLTAKSTGKVNRDEATAIVADWLRNGIPDKKGDGKRSVEDALSFKSVLASLHTLSLTPSDVEKIIDILKGRRLIDNAIVKSAASSRGLVDYLTEFWDYDTSPYIKEKLLHGQKIGRMRAIDSSRVVKYWKQYFSEKKTIGEVTRADIRDFSLWLAEYKVVYKKKNNNDAPEHKGSSFFSSKEEEEKCLSAGTINKIILAGTLPLKWAAYHGEIPTDPGKGLMKFSGTPKARGILTENEAKRIFEVQWKEERSKIASMVSMTTGLRAGEILALKLKDVGKDRLYVNHSWSWSDGLKSTKTGKVRVVPLLPDIRDLLIKLGESNPHGKDGFIFYGLVADKPMDTHFLLDGLKEALKEIGISEAVRVKRNIVFHSWRHYFATKMRGMLDADTVKRATGHSTDAMLEHYAEHEREEDIGTLFGAASNAFSNIIPFEKKSA
ncbi:Integrase domain protein SAM domain protein [uncultured Spirochaetota bacterium]|uniref:Integrase domain protein SAM domain protein n=1 Tax=uncultured Spirochaetota bacterium TaxID=460511 RepID=A0A652ZVT0_9SPIR|nr:Integrase domain protein SAM domain protein [uncultured Spirochaetota bacterium]